MEIRWNNLVALVFGAFAVVMAVTMRHEIGAFLATMTAIGTHRDPNEQALGLIAFSLLIVTIAALAAILSNRRNS